ncbi:MAG: NADH:ubiquinone reductase (Na(+)-transporting) subunit B [Bacteroidales bacterium]|nr:NADH:ubiquinone reductase (Na(+)-transporting) subunit B [Bacteroidales bacterium]
MADEKKTGLFEKGGKLYWLHSTIDAFDTFLRVPGTVTAKGAHVRDGIDLKRVMIMVVIALVPAALFGMYNVGLQTSTLYGLDWSFFHMFWYGLLRMLPLFVVSYVVGLAIEFASSQIRGEEVNEGYLVTGFLIPLIVPVDVPLWMLALAVAFSVIFVKEVFGGTGMNIWNPALVARAFLFFSYPSSMSGSSVWVSKTWVGSLRYVDAISAPTPLAIANEGAYDAISGAVGQYSFMDMFWGFIPGSTGETCVVAILLGAILLVWTGVASWKIMVSSIAGGLLVGWLGNIAGATQLPCYYQLVMGGFLFGSVFMATDPVTTAQTETGKWIYGFLVGALAVVVRLWNPGYMEGMMLAILLMNTFAPLIDHCVVTAAVNRRAKRILNA